MTTLNPQQLAQVAYQAGFRGNALTQAVAVAMAESGGKVDNRSHHPGEDSRGLFQINSVHFGNYDQNRLLTDPLYNAQAAFSLYNQAGSFQPWSVHPDSGTKYGHMAGQHMGAAQAATSSMGGGGGGSFSGGGDMGAQGFSMPSVQSYPTTPPPLGQADLQEFGDRRRAATRSLQDALARAGHGREKVEAAFQQFDKRLGRERTRTTRDTMQGLGGKGVARAPRFGGHAMVNIRDEFADRRAEGESMRADQLGALDQMVSEARTNRDETITGIEADKARRRTGLDQLIRQVGG